MPRVPVRPIVAGVAVWIAVRWLRPFRVEVVGDSMAPTLAPGDFVLAIRPTRIRRGAVVVTAAPGGFDVAKRIVGLPGERVRIDGRGTWVDGRPLEEPYAVGDGPAGEWSLGPREYLVLGDHRRRSTDGRSFGPVAAAAIEGVVVLRYWPRVARIR